MGKAVISGLRIGRVVGGAAGIFAVQRGLWPSYQETQAVRDSRVLTMTPTQFPKRCGKMVSDKLKHSAFSEMLSGIGTHGKRPPPDERDVTVRIILPDGTPQSVKAVFMRVGHASKHWKLRSVGGYDTGTTALGGLKTIEELYPCITK